MDSLGLYLKTGFNLALIEEQHEFLVTVGLSSSIDEYYESGDIGISVPKPRTHLSRLFRAILGRLSRKRPHGWTTAGLHLLNSTDYSEQLRVEKALQRLRRSVRKNYRNPAHQCSLVIAPKLHRKAALIFYLYPNKLRPWRRSAMQQLAQQFMDEYQHEEVCVIGKNTDKWTQPFDTICIGRRPKPTP